MRRSQELGITAVELLPSFEFDELEFQRIPSPRNHMARTKQLALPCALSLRDTCFSRR